MEYYSIESLFWAIVVGVVFVSLTFLMIVVTVLFSMINQLRNNLEKYARKCDDRLDAIQSDLREDMYIYVDRAFSKASAEERRCNNETGESVDHSRNTGQTSGATHGYNEHVSLADYLFCLSGFKKKETPALEGVTTQTSSSVHP